MPPRLVMVKQPPCISSSESLPARAFSASWPSSTASSMHALLVDVADDRHQQAAIGVDGDADVDVLLEDDRFAGHVDRGVELRELLERRGSHLERHRRDRQLALRLRLEALAELLAQLLEIGDVGLLVLRDVRDRRPRRRPCARPSCGGWRASAGARSGPTSRSRAGPTAPARRAPPLAPATVMTCLACAEHVVGRDAAAGARARDVVDVEPELRAPGGGPTARPARADGCRGTSAAAAAAAAAPGARRARSRRPRRVRCPSAWRRRPCRLEALDDGRGLAAGAAAAGRRCGSRRGRGRRGRRRAARRTSTAWPIVTLSPALTLISFTVPATLDGTSIVALSVSSSTTA